MKRQYKQAWATRRKRFGNKGFSKTGLKHVFGRGSTKPRVVIRKVRSTKRGFWYKLFR